MASFAACLPAVPAEVAQFAGQRGLSESLFASLALVRDIFPSARIEPRLEQDAEDERLTVIAIEVDVEGLEVAQLVAAQSRWAAGLFSCCSATHAHLLYLRMV